MGNVDHPKKIGANYFTSQFCRPRQSNPSLSNCRPTPEVTEKKNHGVYDFLGKQGKRVYTIGPERRVYTTEASDLEKNGEKEGFHGGAYFSSLKEACPILPAEVKSTESTLGTPSDNPMEPPQNPGRALQKTARTGSKCHRRALGRVLPFADPPDRHKNVAPSPGEVVTNYHLVFAILLVLL